MPPAPQDNFSVMAGKGQTQISIAELEEWIANLEPKALPTPLDVAVVRRKSAEQVITSLYDQLGLVESDFYTSAWNPKASDAPIPIQEATGTVMRKPRSADVINTTLAVMGITGITIPGGSGEIPEVRSGT